MSILFDGSTQRLSSGAGPYLRNVSSSSMTLWTRPASISSGAHVLAAVSNGISLSVEFRISIERQAAQIRVVAHSLDGDATSNINVADQFVAGEWAHYAATVDYSTATGRLFKNGVLVGSGTFTNMTAGNTSDTDSLGISIGAHGGDARFYDGDIEELLIWDRQLGDAEVASIFAKHGLIGGSRATMIAHFPLRDLAPGDTVVTPADVIHNVPDMAVFGSPTYSDSFTKKRGRRAIAV